MKKLGMDNNKPIYKRVRNIIALLFIIGGYTLLLLMDYETGRHITTCPFKLITGIPCPGCGMGRSTLALFKGEFAQSLYYNILCIPFSLFMVIAFSWLAYDTITGRSSFFETINRPMNNKFKIILFILIALTWALNIYHRI
jgi:hypothetical protein